MTTLFAILLRLLPRSVRRRRAEILRTFKERVAAARNAGGVVRAWRTAAGEVADVVHAAVASRLRAPQLDAPADARTPVPLRAAGHLVADLRFAARQMRRQPGFTATAVVTLALGIGANTAVFSAIYGVLLRPLPYADADRIVAVFSTSARTERGTLSALDARDLGAQNHTLATFAVLARTTANLTGAGDAERLGGYRVSSNFLDVLGAAPVIGRWFTPADMDAGVVILSNRLWRERFGGRPDVLGRTIQLDGQGRTVIGVLAAGESYPQGGDFWTPLVWEPHDFSPGQRGAHNLGGLARLKPGVSIEQAQADLGAIGDRLARQYAGTNAGSSATVVGLRAAQTEQLRPALLALGGGVVLVLLIACANIANLSLTRALTRAPELAVRSSLGASRARLTVQFLVESLLLAALGGAAGLGLSALALKPLLALAPAGLTGLDRIAIDTPVLLATAGVTVLVAVVCGAMPAWQASRLDLVQVGRDAGTRSVTHRGRGRRAVATAELALAVVLVAGAGLLVRTVAELGRVNPGFDPSHVLTFNLTLPETTYGTAAARTGLYARVLGAISTLPGVERAGIGFGVPFSGRGAYTSFSISGLSFTEEPLANLRIVGGDYFQTLRIPVVRGRPLDERDRANSPLVAVINAATARQYFAGIDPIGRRIHVDVSMTRDAPRGTREIVGVVGDVRTGRLDADPAPEIYIPYIQHAVDSGTVVVRTTGAPLDALASIRTRIRGVNADLPLARARALEDLVGASTADRRLTATLLTAFAGLALVMAAVGLYGVFAAGVVMRTREIGIRLALGATGGGVVNLLVREGARLAVVGTGLGLLGALWLLRLLRLLLFGVTAQDPTTLAGACLCLLVVSLAACYLPARRAARLDPVAILQE